MPFARRLLNFPVLAKVMGIPLGVSVLLIAGILWRIHETWHHMLLKELEERGSMLGTDLATHGTEAALSRRSLELQRLLDTSRYLSPDLEYVMALDARGSVLAHTLPGPPSESLLAANHLGPAGQSHVALLETEHGSIRDVAVPIVGGAGGLIRVGMNEARVSGEVSWLTWHLAQVTAVIGVLGMAAAWLIALILTRPIRELVGLTRQIKDGDYRARARIIADDEIGELAAAFNAMTESLGKKEVLRQELMRKVIGAAEEERKRVARELHDQTGQVLTSLIAGLGALHGAEISPELQGRLRELRHLAEQALGDVHDLSLRLRPSAIDDFGLIDALRRHCETVARRAEITVDCQTIGWDGVPRLPAEVEVTLYRIVQEALSNALRHGEAHSIHVLLQRRDSALLIVVEDDGRGFDITDWRARCLAEGHLGLLGMEERASMLGGTLRIESHLSSRTRLYVEIPIPEEVSNGEDQSSHRR